MLKKIKSTVGLAVGLVDTRDVFLFVGLCLVAYGLSLIYLPVAFVAPGAVLVYLAIVTGGE